MRWTHWLQSLANRLGLRGSRRVSRLRRDFTPRALRPLSFERLEDRTLLAVLTVNTLADGFTFGDGLVTLREAIESAELGFATDLMQTGDNMGPDQIVFAAGLTGELDLTGGQFTINQDLTITGASTGTVINAQTLSRIFDVAGVGTDLTLQNLTLKNGRVADDGGAIRSLATGTTAINLVNCTLTINSTTGNSNAGGAIYALNSAVMVTNSTLSGNSTAGSNAYGGAISATNGAVTVTNSTLSGNSTALNNAIWGCHSMPSTARSPSPTARSVATPRREGLPVAARSAA